MASSYAELLVSEDEAVAHYVAEVQRFEEAERRVSTCADTAELPYVPREIEILPVDDSLLPLPYFAYRKRFGYGISAADVVAQPTVMIHLPGNVQVPEGCAQYLYSDEIDVYDAAGDVRRELIDYVAGHDQFAGAQVAWAECMNAEGFDYATPDDAFVVLTAIWKQLDLDDDDMVDEFRDTELRVAEADSQCTRLHFLPITATLEAAFLTEHGVSLPVVPEELGQ